LKKTREGLKKGTVDIVVGTHKILANTVEYKDLGLLIIDEEQRFGVKHKEKIKQLKTNVDVLTLTATPIPRTLHMSLTGVRDLSVIERRRKTVFRYRPTCLNSSRISSRKRWSGSFPVVVRCSTCTTGWTQSIRRRPMSRRWFRMRKLQ